MIRGICLAVLAVSLAWAEPEPPGGAWVPDEDLFALVMKRVEWGMSEEAFRKAWPDATFEGKGWVLTHHNFRNTLVLKAPNTEIRFEFSGVPAGDDKKPTVESSSLVSFTIEHPLKSHPKSYFQAPPDNVHYRYTKAGHDAWRVRLDARGESYERQQGMVGGRNQRYLSGESISSPTLGRFGFTYWNNTGPEGISAKPPPALVAEHIQRERTAARVLTRDWPIPECGNDQVRGPPRDLVPPAALSGRQGLRMPNVIAAED